MEKYFNKYYLLRFFHFIMYVVIYCLLRLGPILLAAYCKISLDKVYDNPDWSWVLFIFLFYLFWLLFGFIFDKSQDHLSKSDDFVETFKPTPLTDKYGKDYKKPTFKQFDIDPEEYYKFNRAFRIDSHIVIIIVWLITLFIAFKVTDHKNSIIRIFILIVAILLSVITHLIIKHINLYLSKKSPHYKKIKNYNEALKKFKVIGKENGENFR